MIKLQCLPSVAVWSLFLTAALPAVGITIQPGVQVGTLSQLAEVSGLVASRSLPGTLWVHNDSGDSARFFGISTAGNVLETISLTGATATDWEDIAIGPKSGGGNYVYLGDIGDNSANRIFGINIYRVVEPLVAGNAAIAAADYTKVTLVYQGLIPKNAESLMVDPLTNDIFVITKASTGQVYRAPSTIFNTPGTTATLALMGNLNVTLPNPTAADISPDGLHILIRNTSTTAYLFERGAAQSVWNALQGVGIPVTLKPEAQGEAIGWAADGSGFYTTSEWNGAGARPVWYYAFSVPEPASGQILLCGLLPLIVGKLWRGRRYTAAAKVDI